MKGDHDDDHAGGEATTEVEAPAAVAHRSSRSMPIAPGRPTRTMNDLPMVDSALYERGAEVARGGLGRIVAARDTRLDRVVALKELVVLHPDARARFAREVLLTSRLQHPNIIPVHEAGRWTDGLPFYAMKLVEGRSLAEAIDEAPDFAARLALLSHVTDIADAMAYAHDQRVIHRDLKPANVLVGPFGETVVIDWGLAKDLDDPTDDAAPDVAPRTTGGMDTSDGAVLGTPAYMPPEQAAGSPVDERADVYAVGAILYQLLAGVRPFARKAPRDVVTAVIEGPPPALATLVPEAPRDLVAIAEKAMARDPNARYPTARELATELRRFSAGRQVDAYQYTGWELFRRFTRRARGVLLTGGVALVVLAVLGVMSVRRVARERDRAEDNARIASSSQHAEELARAEAEARVDQLVLERARSLLDTDPTMSIAWLHRLRTLPVGSVSIAEEARERGVARRILAGHTDVLWDVVATRDAIVTAGSDGVIAWSLSDTTHHPLEGHTDRVQTLALSPDQLAVASGGYDRTVRVWDVARGTAQVFAGHAERVKQVAFAGPDRVLSLDAGGAVRLNRVGAGTSVELPVRARPDGSLEVSRDGRVAAVTGPGFAVEVFAGDGLDHRPLRGHRATVGALALSPDGRSLASGSDDGEVWLWELDGNRGRRLGASTGRITALAWVTGGLASGDDAGNVMVWATDGAAPRRLGAHADRVRALAYAPGGLLISTSVDRSARVWRVDSGDYRALLGHTDAVSAAAVTADGKTLLTASFDRTARVWPLVAPSQLTVGRHQHGVRSVSLSPDGRTVASAGRDHTVGIWSLDASTPGRTLRGHTDLVYRVRFGVDGSHVASSSDDKTVRWWNLADDTSRRFDGHTGDVEEIALSPDGRFLASASKDDSVRLWSLDEARPRGEVATQHDADVTAIAWSPDSRRLASAGRDGVTRIATVADAGASPTRALAAADGDVWDVAYAADGTWLATISGVGVLHRWDSATGAELGPPVALPGARIARIWGDRIAIAGRGTIIWVCERGETTCRELVGHTGAVEDIELRGDLLVSAGADGLVCEWDVTSGEHIALRGHAATVYDVELADGFVLSAGGDGAVIRWPVLALPTRAELRASLDALTDVRLPR